MSERGKEGEKSLICWCNPRELPEGSNKAWPGAKISIWICQVFGYWVIINWIGRCSSRQLDGHFSWHLCGMLVSQDVAMPTPE